MNLYRTAAVVTIFTAAEHFLGFLYRIILSRTLGSEGMGVYQIALTVFAVFLTICSSGLPITLSRVISKHRARGYKRGEHAATSAALLLAVLTSVPVTVLLFLLRTPFSEVFSDPRSADLFYILLVGLSFTSVYAILRGSFWGNKRFFAYSFIELVEEIVMIAVGILLLVLLPFGVPNVNCAAIAVLVSYLCSFSIAAVYFFAKGGKLRSPRGEFLPLLRSSLPVTAMRSASSLMSSFISVLFPMRLMAAGYSSSRAMSEYGVVYGMVMPVLMIPSSLIGSIALVLVPELSECFYKKEKEKLSALVEKALNAALLISGMLVPFFLVLGEDLGIVLFASAESGKMIARAAALLLPMSVTMISTSILNSLGCERQTLLFFLIGSCGMLACVWFFSGKLGSDALILGMAVDHLLTAGCSLVLLRKKTGSLRSMKYFGKLLLVCVPVTVIAVVSRKLLMRVLGFFPSLFLSVLLVFSLEGILLALFKLFDFPAFFRKFLPKGKKRNPVRA